MKWDKQNIKIVLIFVVVAIRKKKRLPGLFSLRIDDVMNMCDV